MNEPLIASRFRHFAEHECPGEPLYQALCHLAAADPALHSLLSSAPLEQQRPSLWLAALHAALLATPDTERPGLADYYPNLGGTRAPDAALAPALHAFIGPRREALRTCMATQRTQTNEIGRCAVLRPALHAIAARSGHRRLALLDVGCSAGLNLGVDHYRCDYLDGDGKSNNDSNDDAKSDGPGGNRSTRRDAPTPALLHCTLQGGRRPPLTPPFELVHRSGIDPAPIDVHDEAAVRWLQACLWPGDAARAGRLQHAVALARREGWPVQRVADCTAQVARWLDSLPADVQPVVFNSWVLHYFDAAALARHIETMQALVRERGLMWLSAEPPTVPVLPGGEAASRAVSQTTADTLWVLCSRSAAGAVQHELLARSHPHGRWMAWLGR